MPTLHRLARLLALALVLATLGCGRTVDREAAASREQDWLAWRKATDDELRTSPTSFLKAQDAVYMAPGTTAYLRDQTAAEMRWLVAADPPADELLRVGWDGEHATLTGLGTSFDLLEHGEWTLPDGLTLKAGEQKDGSLRVTLFNPDHPYLAGFDGLRFFDYDPAAVVKARFRKAPEVVERPFTTTRDRQSHAFIVGRVSFVYDSVPIEMDAFTFDREDSPSYLALLFKDRTSGHESYGGGRYLTVDLPDGLPRGELELDFNRSSNFLCARSPHWNCPVLWEPALPVAIRAGEMAPPGMHH